MTLIIIQKAKSLMMTSNEINGDELNNLGILYKLCNREDMDDEFNSLIESLDKQSFISICMVNKLFFSVFTLMVKRLCLNISNVTFFCSILGNCAICPHILHPIFTFFSHEHRL